MGKTTYTIDHFTKGGWHYRTTYGCPWAEVKRRRRVAKALGESIMYVKEN